MKQYLYISSNPSMPGLLKIGKTTTSPNQRMSELHSTGVPTPFSLEISLEVDDCDVSERAAHQALKKYRVADNREFFRVTVKIALQSILPVIGSYIIHETKSSHGIEDIEAELKIIAEQKRCQAEEARRQAEEARQQEDSKKAAEDTRRKQEAALEEKRRMIMLRHEADLNAVLPSDFTRYYFFVGIAILGAIGIFIPTIRDANAILLLIIGTPIITAFLKDHIIEKAKASDNYQSILAKRDAELAALENGYGGADASGAKIVVCPKCSQKLRIPANKILEVTCPSCRYSFQELSSQNLKADAKKTEQSVSTRTVQSTESKILDQNVSATRKDIAQKAVEEKVFRVQKSPDTRVAQRSKSTANPSQCTKCGAIYDYATYCPLCQLKLKRLQDATEPDQAKVNTPPVERIEPTPTPARPYEPPRKKWSYNNKTRVLRNNNTGKEYFPKEYERQQSSTSNGYQILHGSDAWANDFDIDFVNG